MPKIDFDLPIIQPDPPKRKSAAETYGSFYYLGIGGLVVVVGMIVWFGSNVWRMRDVWGRVYIATDPRRAEADRIQAAYALSRDSRLSQRQIWDLALNRSVPELGRYLLAERLTSEIVADGPRAYAVAVARSEGWPDWLRLMATRPLAYAAAEGQRLPAEPLAELRRHSDPIVSLWASFADAARHEGDPEAALALDRADPSELASFLNTALQSRQPDRNAALDRATLWLRSNHPAAAKLWTGWEERGGRLVPRPASELHGVPEVRGSDRADGPGHAREEQR